MTNAVEIIQQQPSQNETVFNARSLKLRVKKYSILRRNCQESLFDNDGRQVRSSPTIAFVNSEENNLKRQKLFNYHRYVTKTRTRDCVNNVIDPFAETRQLSLNGQARWPMVF